MPSAGELLRSERLQRNRTLADISSKTCITTRYLEAIEANDTKILPGDFFHRSFIRQYASALGLEEPVTKRILDAVEPAPDVDPIPAFSVPLQIADVEQRSKPLAYVPTRVAVVLFFVVLLGCSGLYALWSRAHESADLVQAETTTPPPPVISTETPAKAPEQAPPPASTAAENPGTPTDPAPVAPVAEATAASTTDPGKISVDLSATETTWISLSSAGRTVFAGILDASQTKNFAVDDNARLLTGNAAGLDVRMNGRPIGPLGSRGQVRVVLFTPDNYQILSPRGM